MKILLIEPAKAPLTIGGEDIFLYESLALEYIAAGVAEDHDVEILDLRLEKDLDAKLDDFCPDIVGITSYTVHVNTVKSLFNRIKERNSGILTVVGGHHATVAPEDFGSPDIDVVVSGEGVFVFKEIVRRFESGKGFDGIPGVAYANGDGFIRTERSNHRHLDDFPFPDRKITGRYRKHYYSEWMKPLASIRTSKGCSYRCNFCALWKISGGCYLTRSPEKIVEELATIDEECVFFADDESLVDAARMRTLAGLLKESGIKKRYFLYGRSDTIARNPKLIEAWRDVGLERVFVGLEFFRDEDLEYIKKGSTTGDNDAAIRILHDLGIDVYASFIIRPEFDRADFAALRRYCRDLELGFASFAVLTPLPGTDLYEDVKGQMITNNYDYFDFIHTLLPTTLPLKEFYEEYYQLLMKGISFKNRLFVMRKFPVKDIVPTFVRAVRVFNRLRKAHLDYGDALGEKGMHCTTP